MPEWDPMRRRAALVAIGVVVAAPVSCSSSGSGDDAAQNQTRIVVEGQTRTVDGTTVCLDGPTGEVTIEVNPAGTAPGATSPNPIVVLDLTPQGAAPSVSLLAINLPDIALSAGRYRTSGVPTATKAGNTYTVKGQATVVGTPPDRPVYKAFELEITCP
jgi:Mycobacterium 19 kDa lipoprotein antigen